MINILTANVDDCQAIITLQQLAYQSEARLYNDWSLPALIQTATSLAEEMARLTILKAVFQGEIIGSVRAHLAENTLKIGRLIVHPDFQRQGIGSALLRQIERMVDNDNHRNIDRYELFTGSKSAGNIRLYQHHGYSIETTQRLSSIVEVVYLVKSIKKNDAWLE